MSKLEITYCDICKDEIHLETGQYNYLRYFERTDDIKRDLIEFEMDICIKCFKIHILPLKKKLK